MSHWWERSEEKKALDVKFEFESKYQGRGVSVTFRSDNTALVQMDGGCKQDSWTILEEDELRVLMGALMERFPLDALGEV